jgi:hypothetical protein
MSWLTVETTDPPNHCGGDYLCDKDELHYSRNLETNQIFVIGISWITIETYQITEA